MKKHFTAALLAVFMCISCLAMFVGCSAVSVLEKDLRLVLNVDGEIYAVYDISIYNNAVITEPKAPEGKSFYGWSPQENWAEKEQSEVIVTPKTTFIAYNDVKDYVKKGSSSLTLYAAFYEIPPKDLVVAWYRAEGVSTQTGLTQEIMDTFTQNMYTFLETKDYTPAEMDIVVRAYDGNVGTSCGNLLSDGDVDLMVGWGGNIGSTGGVQFIENVDKVQIGTVSRYAARLNDKYLSRLVFVWILNTYGGQNLEYPDPAVDPTPDPDPEPTPDPDPQPVNKVVIGWYAKTGTTGLDFLMMKNFKKGLEDYVATLEGFTSEIEIRELVSALDVAGVGAEVNAAGDYDILLGMGGNITSTGKIETKELVDYTMGGKNRNIARLSDDEDAALIFQWIQTEEVKAYFPARDAITSTTLVIGWYNKTDTSGLNQTIIDNLNTALTAYLQNVYGKNATLPTVTFRGYEGNVKNSGAAILADGDVDLLIGWVHNITTNTGKGGNVPCIDEVDGIAMGTQNGRYMHRLTENDLGVLVYNWLQTEEAATLLKG